MALLCSLDCLTYVGIADPFGSGGYFIADAAYELVQPLYPRHQRPPTPPSRPVAETAFFATLWMVLSQRLLAPPQSHQVYLTVC